MSTNLYVSNNKRLETLVGVQVAFDYALENDYIGKAQPKVTLNTDEIRAILYERFEMRSKIRELEKRLKELKGE